MVLGAWLILGLPLSSAPLVYALVAVLLFEVVAKLRVPGLLARLRADPNPDGAGDAAYLNPNARVSFEAGRGLRLSVATLILIPMSGVADFLWLPPWFMGFALIGAGLGGIRPMALALRWLGLR